MDVYLKDNVDVYSVLQGIRGYESLEKIGTQNGTSVGI